MEKSRLKDAAVIVLLDADTGELILTRRTRHLSVHPGEICFPGGRFENGDCDLRQTALRELQEELGIAAERVDNLLALGQQTTLTGYAVSAWLGTIKTLTPCCINPQEVESIVSLDLREVLNRKNYANIEVEYAGIRIKTIQFNHHQHYIWGATAHIMQNLCRQDDALPVLKEVLKRIE